MKLGSKLITKQMPWHANMTEMNHLGKALISKPDKFESRIGQLFSASMYSDNPLTAVTIAEGRVENTNSNVWEWDLRAANSRPLVVLEDVDGVVAGSKQQGKFKSVFKLKLDESWYEPGDVISPGATNKKYQCRVQEEAQASGKGFVYTIRLMSDDPQAFVPAQYFAPGTQWGKLYSQYAEAEDQSGSTQYSLPISLQNRMSRFRKKYRVTGDVHDDVLAVKIPDSKGVYHDSWIKYAEVEYWQQWYRELERGYWYSRSTDTVLSANGRPIKSGPGLQEQLEDSHIQHYSNLSARLIEEYLMDIFYSRVKPGAKRQMKGWSGEYGMIQFHRSIQDWATQTGFIQVVDNLFMEKTSSEYNTNALAAGYQFTKYRMANGAELEMIHNPLYDDREINFELDPITGYPMESQRITFMDFSGEGSSSNVRTINKNKSYKLGYVAGLTNPYGSADGSLMSHSGNYYEMHVEKQCGLHIEDVSRCGELILDRQ